MKKKNFDEKLTENAVKNKEKWRKKTNEDLSPHLTTTKDKQFISITVTNL